MLQDANTYLRGRCCKNGFEGKEQEQEQEQEQEYQRQSRGGEKQKIRVPSVVRYITNYSLQL